MKFSKSEKIAILNILLDIKVSISKISITLERVENNIKRPAVPPSTIIGIEKDEDIKSFEYFDRKVLIPEEDVSESLQPHIEATDNTEVVEVVDSNIINAADDSIPAVSGVTSVESVRCFSKQNFVEAIFLVSSDVIAFGDLHTGGDIYCIFLELTDISAVNFDTLRYEFKKLTRLKINLYNFCLCYLANI
jgi:hypothetical protein